jgi:hypothetical protein
MCVILSYILTPTCSNMAYAYGSDYNGLTTLQYMYHVNELQFKTSQQWPVALFTKILTIKNCRKCKTKIKKSFTKIITIILSVKIVLTLRVKLPCPKCKMLIVREILVHRYRRTLLLVTPKRSKQQCHL